MNSVFNFKSYREYLKAHFKTLPKSGYGQSRKLALFLNVHTTLVSQVIKGKKTFTMEQASLTCEFFSLSDAETDYFLLIVQLDRAGSISLKRNLNRQLTNLQKQSRDLSNRLNSQAKLSDIDRGIFYSDWHYSAVRQLTAIKGFQTTDKLATKLNLPRKKIKAIVEFLLHANLCTEESGILKVGPSSTHLEASSPWIRLHHLNWRQKSIASLNAENSTKLHYTAPMTLSLTDAELLREILLGLIEKVTKIVEPSNSEEFYCLNIDWFQPINDY